MHASRSARQGAFVSYARADGEALARDLVARLAADAPDVPVWLDRLELEGGVGWWNQIERQLDRVEFLVIVMTPAAMRSENTRREWRAARQRGVRVFPVKGAAPDELDYGALPRWMHKAHFYDPGVEWEKFVAHLRRGGETVRVPFMAPPLPAAYVARPRETSALRERLLSESDDGSPTIVLRAPGGYGKTSLAAALCHDDDVIEAFDDGVLWVTLGQTPDLAAELLKLYAALTGERPGFVDVEDAARELGLRLQDKNCLIVVDDAWNAAHVRPFLLARGPRHLITTRVFEVAFGAERIDLALLDDEEAVHVMLARAGIAPAGEAGPYRALAQRLGGWPLALKLAGAAMRQRIARGDLPERALQYVAKALDRHGLTAFDAQDPVPGGTVAATLARSLDLLDETARRRYAELSIFPEDLDVPLGAVAALWGLDDFDTEELARRLDDLALAEFDLKRGTLSLHDVLRSLMAERLPDAASVHARLADAWGSRPSDAHAWRWLAWHLRGAGRIDALRALLTDPDWLAAKLAATDVYALAADFDAFAEEAPMRLLRDALRLSSAALAQEPGQLAQQLRMRLLGRAEPEIVALCERLSRRVGDLLTPLHASFDAPGGLLAMTLLGHDSGVQAIAWTRDGRQLLSVAEDRVLRVWTRDGLPLATIALPAVDLRAVAVDARARRAVVGSAGGRLIVVDLRTGVVTDKLFDDPRRAIDALVLSGDGTRAATAGRGGEIHVWDLEAKVVLHRLPARGERVRALALSADDRILVAGNDAGWLTRWDFATGVPIDAIEAHTMAVTSVATSADARLVLSGSADRVLCAWDTSRGSVRRLRGHEAGITAVDVDAAGCLALSGASNRVMNVWRLDDGELLAQVVAHADTVHALRFGAAPWAASASGDRSIRLWRLDELDAERPREAHEGPVTALAFGPDGRQCASAGGDGGIRLWEVASGRCVQTFPGAGAPVQSLAFTPDGLCIVSGTGTGRYRLWFIDSGDHVWMPVRHAAPVDHGVFSSNARFLVTSCPDRYVYFWDVSSGSLVARYGTRRLFDHLIPAAPRRGELGLADEWLDAYLPGEPIYQVQGIALSSDGGHAALGARPVRPGSMRAGRDGAEGEMVILVLDIVTGAIETVPCGSSTVAPAFAIGGDGDLLAWAGGDHAVRLWDGGAPRRLVGHRAPVRSIAIAPRLGLVLACGMDRSLRCWRIADGEPAATLIGDSPMLVLALSPDERTAAVGDQQGRVHLLRLAPR